MSDAKSTGLPIRVRANLFTSLAGLETAGLPADKAFALLRLPGAAQGRLDQACRQIARGSDIATAGERSGLFTSLEVSVLRAALHAGSPAATYRRLAEIYTEQAQQIAAIKSRLALPLLVVIVALLTQPLPGLVSGALSGAAYVWQVLSPLAMLAGMYFLLAGLKAWLAHAPNSPVKTHMARLLTRVPLFGAMHVRRNHRDFYASLALMLEAGIPLLDALPKAVETVSNRVIREDLSRIHGRMLQRATFAQAIGKRAYPGNAQVIGYVQTGETSGTLPEMLTRFVQSETNDISQFQREAATWLPRLVYGLVLLWMAYGVLTGSAFMPHVPQGL